MRLQVKGKNLEVSDSIRSYAEQKLRKLSKQLGETVQVELDIQAISQAFFGTPNLEQVRAADRIRVHDESGYQALRSLLAGPPDVASGGVSGPYDPPPDRGSSITCSIRSL